MSDDQSINSSAFSKSTKEKKKKDKDKDEDMSISEYKKLAKADAKKIKVLKEMCQDFKVKQEESEKQIDKLVNRNVMLEKEVHDQENKFLELYEEYQMLNDDMHEL